MPDGSLASESNDLETVDSAASYSIYSILPLFLPFIPPCSSSGQLLQLDMSNKIASSRVAGQPAPGMQQLMMKQGRQACKERRRPH
jgi:hypothetical protein